MVSPAAIGIPTVPITLASAHFPSMGQNPLFLYFFFPFLPCSPFSYFLLLPISSAACPLTTFSLYSPIFYFCRLATAYTPNQLSLHLNCSLASSSQSDLVTIIIARLHFNGTFTVTILCGQGKESWDISQLGKMLSSFCFKLTIFNDRFIFGGVFFSSQ